MADIRKVSGADELTLEAIIDRSSVYAVLMALGRITAAKAEHIRVNWQDDTLARQWDRASNPIDRLATKIGPFSI
jgi:hypothetical protein